MTVARFAHEDAIVDMVYAHDGKTLLTVAEDKTLKLWDTSTYTELKLWDNLPENIVAMAPVQNQKFVITGQMDGKLSAYPLPKPIAQVVADHPTEHSTQSVSPETLSGKMSLLNEKEPNNTPKNAQRITLPAEIKGVVFSKESTLDFDLFQFSAKKGETWIFEINAARSKSPLDSHLEILTSKGERVERVKLQAIRDSYFTFRGKDDRVTNDFRVFNWQEMKLNQYLYANGEVVKLHLYPRGPDSGYNVYPGRGSRWGYFETTPLAHALGEPCYIVEELSPNAKIIPNGLPVFTLYYENDDEPQRKAGRDSKLTFNVPTDGTYLVKVKDVRSQQGDNYRYTLTARTPKPSYSVRLSGNDLTFKPGTGRDFKLSAVKNDNFDDDITITLDNLPEGFTTTSPIVIEKGQTEAIGVLYASQSAKAPSPEATKKISIKAVATINGKAIEQAVGGFKNLKINTKAKIVPTILPHPTGVKPLVENPDTPYEFEIKRGETIKLKLKVERNGHKGIISFGKEDSGRNLPFGTYVDNIGLNGLMLLGNQSEREIFITCDEATTPQTRMFHLTARQDGNPCTLPVILHVLDK